MVGAFTAADFRGKHVVVVCWRRQRLGIYSKERFAELIGYQTALPDGLRIVALSGRSPCPRADKDVNILHDRCEIQYYRPD